MADASRIIPLPDSDPKIYHRGFLLRLSEQRTLILLFLVQLHLLRDCWMTNVSTFLWISCLYIEVFLALTLALKRDRQTMFFFDVATGILLGMQAAIVGSSSMNDETALRFTAAYVTSYPIELLIVLYPIVEYIVVSIFYIQCIKQFRSMNDTRNSCITMTVAVVIFILLSQIFIVLSKVVSSAISLNLVIFSLLSSPTICFISFLIIRCNAPLNVSYSKLASYRKENVTGHMVGFLFGLITCSCLQISARAVEGSLISNLLILLTFIFFMLVPESSLSSTVKMMILFCVGHTIIAMISFKHGVAEQMWLVCSVYVLCHRKTHMCMSEIPSWTGRS